MVVGFVAVAMMVEDEGWWCAKADFGIEVGGAELGKKSWYNYFSRSNHVI